jgi:hypothetical protein
MVRGPRTRIATLLLGSPLIRKAHKDAKDQRLHRTRNQIKGEEEEHLIIAEQERLILDMSVSEAVMKMDLTRLPVTMFKNSENGRINVVYKRPDGHVGWIDYTDRAE